MKLQIVFKSGEVQVLEGVDSYYVEGENNLVINMGFSFVYRLKDLKSYKVL